QALQQEHDEQQVAKYSAVIKSLAAQYWNRPPSARNSMVAEFRISLSPFGDVLDISMVKSSGNDEFDRSVIQAIKRASPFSELKQLDRRVFEQYFRRIIFRFKPEDLVR
ncbi:MAG: energy transducer TonB, partial [Endozoicomonas sp.]